MPVKTIQLGQVWRNDVTGEDFLVTKLYNEVFSQFAVLRPARSGAADSDTIRIKIQKESSGVVLPGFSYTQDLQGV